MSKYVIDGDVVENNGLQEWKDFFFLMYVYTSKGKASRLDYDRMLDLCSISENGDCFMTSKSTNELLENILAESQSTKTNKGDRVKNLIEECKKHIPAGKQPNTGYYWKGDSKTVIKKLTKFLVENGEYTDEQIIEAHRIYYSSFDRQLRIWPYFIEKDGKSELLELLENKEEATAEETYEFNSSVF